MALLSQSLQFAVKIYCLFLPALALIGAFNPAKAQTQTPASSLSPLSPVSPVSPLSPSSTNGPEATTPTGKTIEVKTQRYTETDERRESTASKIVVGREEIERHGDTNLSDVLKRLPGITIQGAPGRGGALRLRGLGSGYTQILLDGQRVPPGFSIDSLSPDQVEKIEILRAPTAETGARAIAGTVNIVLREGQRSDPDEFKLGASLDKGRWSEKVSWVHKLKTEGMNGSITLSAYESRRGTESQTLTTGHTDAAGQQAATDTLRERNSSSQSTSQGLHANARMQWRGEAGRSLVLMPFLVASSSKGNGLLALNQTVTTDGGGTTKITEQATTESSSNFSMVRMNGQWNAPLSKQDKLEIKFSGGRNSYDTATQQTPSGTANLLLPTTEQSKYIDLSANTQAKWIRDLTNGHQIVSGIELDGATRDETTTAAQSDDAGDLKATTRRWAMYAQDEWTINPQWSAYAGLRYENIRTLGSSTNGDKANNSGVASPLFHLLWKPIPSSRDQVRMSLTRSYKSPSLVQLVALPTLSRETNSATRTDRVGNPDLLPELATGIDVAFEHYFSDGGLLSANVFYRQISNLIRTTTAPVVNPTWAPGQTRWVSSPNNVGDATTQGLELEAKFRLNQILTSAWPIDVRSNVSFYQSRVDGITGPDNRLDQQPDMSANLGLDYRLRALPLTVGGNFNYNPDYSTRMSETVYNYQGAKKVLDVYGLWRYSPKASLRVSISNLTPTNYLTASNYSSNGLTENARTTSPNWQIIQLRLELKI